MRGAILLLVCAGLLVGGCGSTSTPDTGAAATPARPKTTPAKPGSKLTFNAKPHYAAPSPSAPVRSGLVRITYREFTVDPEVVRARAGTTIEWHSEDPGEDNVTSHSGPQSFASANFGAGGTFKVRLTRAGIYHYISTLHAATINGTIEILG